MKYLFVFLFLLTACSHEQPRDQHRVVPLWESPVAGEAASSGEEPFPTEMFESFHGIHDGFVYFSDKSSLYKVAIESGKIKWKANSRGGNIVVSGQLVYRLYQESEKAHLKILNQQGQEVGDIELNYRVILSFMLYNHTLIFTTDEKVYGFDLRSRKVTWELESSPNTTIMIADSTLFLANVQEKLYALDPKSGKPRWMNNCPGTTLSHLTANGEILYMHIKSENESALKAISTRTGEYLWQYPSSFYELNEPTIHDGRLYVGTDNSTLVCLDAGTGSIQWEQHRQINEVSAHQIVIRHDYIFYHTWGKLYGIDPKTKKQHVIDFKQDIHQLLPYGTNLFLVTSRGTFCKVVAGK